MSALALEEFLHSQARERDDADSDQDEKGFEEGLKHGGTPSDT